MHFIKTSLFLSASLAAVYAQNSGDATFYEAGMGSCGQKNADTDLIVALSPADINGKANCGKHINVKYNGKSVNATVVDTCPSCAKGSIDLSPSAFQALAPQSEGRIKVQWNWA